MDKAIGEFMVDLLLVARHEAKITEIYSQCDSYLRLFPNPFSTIIETNMPIEIFDVSGRKVSSGIGKLDLAGQSPGIYFAVAKINNKMVCKKILKIN